MCVCVCANVSYRRCLTGSAGGLCLSAGLVLVSITARSASTHKFSLSLSFSLSSSVSLCLSLSLSLVLYLNGNFSECVICISDVGCLRLVPENAYLYLWVCIPVCLCVCVCERAKLSV